MKYPGSLHNHTDFSNLRLRDCIITYNDLIDYAIQLGHKGVAVTDHEAVSNAVKVEKYSEQEDIDRISASIFCEHKSQKGILIGKGGSLLKKIGTESRLELEKIVEKKVYLELQVKVEKDWRKKEKILKNFGYQQEKE